MNCPNCRKILPENINIKMQFCPFCGGKLFEEGKTYLIKVNCTGQRGMQAAKMMLFIDETVYYEILPGESICFQLPAGFHSLKFRHKIRSKIITLPVGSDYVIRAYFNTLSGLIETSLTEVEEKDHDATFKKAEITKPTLVSKDGQRTFDIMLGEDEPELTVDVTSGLKEGTLKLFSQRIEFRGKGDINKDTVYYTDMISARKMLGNIDIQCAGNVHKVYSIPKDSYNDVMVFLTNRIAEFKGL
jgi:hypothetical protein